MYHGDEQGPYPYTTRLTPLHHAEAHALARDIQQRGAPSGIELETDLDWPSWFFLRLPWPGHPGRDLVLCLPTVDGPWGEASASGFSYCVKSSTPTIHTDYTREGCAALCPRLDRASEWTAIYHGGIVHYVLCDRHTRRFNTANELQRKNLNADIEEFFEIVQRERAEARQQKGQP